MGMLNQSNFPRLWRLFQWSIGGSCHKRRLVGERLGRCRHVLEVGCSVGNIAPVFAAIPDLHYTGVDIDEAALRTARRTYRHDKRFQFLHGEIERLDLPKESFDLIVLSAVLHHVDDDGCRRILNACSKLLAPDGELFVTDPVQPIDGDPWLVRFFNSIEQGQYVRTSRAFDALLDSTGDLEAVNRCEFFLKGSPLGFPNITRCVTLQMRRTPVGSSLKTRGSSHQRMVGADSPARQMPTCETFFA